MSFRFRDDDSSTGTTIASVLLGAMAGFAVGMYVAQRVGGFGGLTAKLRKRRAGASAQPRYERGAELDEIEEEDELLDEDGDDIGRTAASDADEDFNGMDATDADDTTPLIEERVLEAFNNDPILAERAVDIGAVSDGIIELAGWVDTDDEAEHAVTIARGVPGVDTVINRLMVEEEERELVDSVRRGEDGDPAITESRWEGQQVGTGKRRQGTSDEADRHADPKPVLEERWLSEREAVRNAADDLSEISAERRKKRGKVARGDQPEPTA